MTYTKHNGLEKDILKKIFKNKNIDVWDLAKNYPWSDKRMFLTKNEEYKYFTGKHHLIMHYLKKLVNNGTLVKRVEKDKNIYEFPSNRIRFTKCYKFHDTVAEAISVKDKNNKWTIYQI